MGLLWRRRSELHEDQIRVIESLPVDGKYLLTGPPGSGKTSILLHRGQYIRGADVGHVNIRLVTFARALKEFIAANGDDRFPPELIQTMASFIKEIHEAYDVSIPEYDSTVSFTQKNRQLARSALRLLQKRQRKLNFDFLLVDEVQDLCKEEISVIESLSARQMLCGDARQKLFDAIGGMEEIQRLGYEVIELNHHFRISLPICRIADNISIIGDYRLQDWCRYNGPTPATPQITGNLTREEQIGQLISSLDIQYDTYNNPEDIIGIVTQKQADCDTIVEKLDEIDKFSGKIGVLHSGIRNRRFDSEWKICVMTVKSCKGLEFRALHWLFIDEDNYLTRSAAYTVVTRAKTSLNLYHYGKAPRFLAGAFPSRGGGLFEDD